MAEAKPASYTFTEAKAPASAYRFTTLPKFAEHILDAPDLTDGAKVAMLQAYRRAVV